MADLLDVASRTMSARIVSNGFKRHVLQDPYEFIDDLDHSLSPTSYKEFQIKHSPLKVRGRIKLFRASKMKKYKGLRKSTRINYQEFEPEETVDIE